MMATLPCDEQLPLVPAQQSTQAAEAASESHSYDQILKSSALIGGSSVLNIAIGIVRTKAMAMFLGPAGLGLAGLYTSIIELTQNIAGMGVNSSGVRQIAEAYGSGDTHRIASTAAVLRRTSIVLGAIGAIALLLFSRQISALTFGDTRHAAAVSLLSLAVFFRLVSAGQAALIQGMRRISDLAKMGVLGALLGTAASIPLVYFFRERGVAPSLVVVTGMTIITSWWYNRKLNIQPVKVTLSQVKQESSALLKLGSAFMASGFMSMGVAYFVRITVLHKVGFEATGIYQSAWNLGGFYVGIILGAMGADFYPRLTSSIHDHQKCNRLVNEQMLIGLLLAGPGVLATITFAPLVIMLFYSAKFGAAVAILRWICLGATLQVITWPMGFIIVAKNNRMLYFLVELSWAIFAVGSAYIGILLFGVTGAGIASFVACVFHAFLIYPIVHRLTGFQCSPENLQIGSIYCASIGVAFSGFFLFSFVTATLVATIVLLLNTTYSIRSLLRIVPLKDLPAPFRRIALICGLKRAEV